MPCCASARLQNSVLSADKSINDVRTSSRWIEIKKSLDDGVFPVECQDCSIKENIGVDTTRKLLNQEYKDILISGDYNDGKLRYLEFAGSNICNLGCITCSPEFSSKWNQDYIKLYDNHKVISRLPDPDLIKRLLIAEDLSKLGKIMFKGGEPMLNSETTEVLSHMDDLGILNELTIELTTNGTLINDDIVSLLNKAKLVRILISIDGPPALNDYMRYGNYNFVDIENAIRIYNEMPNVRISFSSTISAYNVCRMVEVRDWWIEMAKKYKRVNSALVLDKLLLWPMFMRVSTLTTPFRQTLIDHYRKNQINNEFNTLINFLSDEYLGDEQHNKWVNYTRSIERIRNNSLIDVEPLLIDEMRLI
jgi:sulfatase maturation enzyme AslB (radical SAM superfamily)